MIYLAVKKLSALLIGITSKHYDDFTHLEQKTSLNRIKKSVKINIFVML